MIYIYYTASKPEAWPFLGFKYKLWVFQEFMKNFGYNDIIYIYYIIHKPSI